MKWWTKEQLALEGVHAKLDAILERMLAQEKAGHYKDPKRVAAGKKAAALRRSKQGVTLNGILEQSVRQSEEG